MKRLLIAVLAAGLLSGCAGELRDEAAESTNSDVMHYVLRDMPECSDVSSVYEANLKEMHYRESKGAMNAQEDATAIEGAKAACERQNEFNARVAAENAQEHANQYQEDERMERLCEAAHPFMMRQCIANSGINEMVDAL